MGLSLAELILLLIGNYAWMASWLMSCGLLGITLWGLLSYRSPGSARTWPNPELAIFFMVCAGLSIQILVLLALALAGLLRPAPIILALAVLSLGSLAFLYRQQSAWQDFAGVFRVGKKGWLTILPVTLIILPWIIRPLGPPQGMDALTYHLPYARFYLELGGLAVNENLRFPLHTHNINLLYAVAMIRPGAALAQMLHACMGFLAILGIYGMARHWHGWFSAVLAASGILLLAEYQRSFTYAFADNGTLLFITAALLAMALWCENRQSRILWICALFAGTAMGSKYFGALFTVPLGLMLLWFSRDVKLTIRFALLTSSLGLFWYMRSWWISGNPVHPFAGEIFGYYLWTESDLASNLWELGKWGVEKTWLNFLMLPELMFSKSHQFNGQTGNAGYLVGAFGVSLLLIKFQKPAVRALQITCLTYLLFWFWTSQVVRYLLLAVPLMSLCTVSAFAGFLKSFHGYWKPPSAAVEFPALLLVFSWLLWDGLVTARTDLNTIPLTEQAQSAFLKDSLPAYELGTAASTDPRIGAGPLLQVQVPEIRFFYHGGVAGDWMGVHGWKKYGHIGPSGHWELNHSEELHQQVLEAGFKAVALRKSQDVQFKPQDIDSYRQHFEILLETETGVLMIPRKP